MTWVATLNRKGSGSGQINVEILYEDQANQRRLTKAYKNQTVTDESLETLARTAIEGFIDQENNPLTYVADDVIDTSPPSVIPPIPPTPEEEAEALWMAGWNELNALELLKTETVFVDDARIGQLKTSLAANYLPSYLPNVRW